MEDWKYNYINNNKSGYYSKKKTLEKYPEIYEKILESNGIDLKEKCYCLAHNIKETPLCICGKKVRFENSSIGYRKTCSNSCGSKQGKPKYSETMLCKYGVTHYSQIKSNVQKSIERRKEMVKSLIGNSVLEEYIIGDTIYQDILKIKCNKCDEIHEMKLGIFQQKILLNDYCEKVINNSNRIDLLEFIRNNYSGKIIDNNDIILPEMKLVISYNILNSLYKDKYYHYNEWLEYNEKCIDLIQIYEDEWKYKQDIVKSRILNILNKSEIIYARNCDIKKVKFNECSKFLDDNHLQGKVNSSINYGLYYNNELISIMTFGKPRKGLRYKPNGNIYELYRFCNKKGYSVIGGASKLFKKFKDDYIFDIIYSYSFIEWKGDVYNKLGFKLDNISKESYWYFSKDKRISRHTVNNHNLIKMGYNDISEMIKDLNLSKINGAGIKRYIYKN